MATAYVNAGAALILAVLSLSAVDLKSAILAGVDPVPASEGRTVSGGRLNVCSPIPGCT